MGDSRLGELKRAIESQHGGRASFVQSVPVTETHDGQTVWQADRRKRQTAVLRRAAYGGDQIATRRGKSGNRGGASNL